METVYEIHDKQGSYEDQFRVCTPDESETAIQAAMARINPKLNRARTREEIIASLAAGNAVAFGETANYYYTHDLKKIRVRPAPRQAPALVKCSCGHSVPRGSVMSASTGSSCPDCYDRMSE